MGLVTRFIFDICRQLSSWRQHKLIQGGRLTRVRVINRLGDYETSGRCLIILQGVKKQHEQSVGRGTNQRTTFQAQ